MMHIDTAEWSDDSFMNCSIEVPGYEPVLFKDIVEGRAKLPDPEADIAARKAKVSIVDGVAVTGEELERLAVEALAHEIRQTARTRRIDTKRRQENRLRETKQECSTETRSLNTLEPADSRLEVGESKLTWKEFE